MSTGTAQFFAGRQVLDLGSDIECRVHRQCGNSFHLFCPLSTSGKMFSCHGMHFTRAVFTGSLLFQQSPGPG
jgi:hypothetical protein